MNWITNLVRRFWHARKSVSEIQVHPTNNVTPRVQQMLKLTRKEADRFKNNFVGTQHVILGLIKLNEGVGLNALKMCGVDLTKLRRDIESLCVMGNAALAPSIPYTQEVKKILEVAAEEAMALDNDYLGTEHIVLAILKIRRAPIGPVIQKLDLPIDRLRLAVRTFQAPAIYETRARFLRCVLSRARAI